MTKDTLAQANTLYKEMDHVRSLLQDMRTALKKQRKGVNIAVTVADPPGYNPTIVHHELTTFMQERLIVALEGILKDLERMFETL